MVGLFLLTASAGILLVVLCTRAIYREHLRALKAAQLRDEYLKSHPPISDEEFLKRCGPGVPSDTALKVRSILAEYGILPREQFYPDTNIFTMFEEF
ncbi:hypothetical protein [Planctomicrobium piriforme]|uniref:Uncharacterized protein n=1 Tax=Planctomicrobium piriforme TaxID=1576369 RepID=A0A1I3K3V9_9PLAN|nr:hypothetical protein [Planctomicrobium piriforme]SFI67106.1 hypothetical protein SAMN05421753_111108 [Planctomicrobium piriforme]